MSNTDVKSTKYPYLTLNKNVLTNSMKLCCLLANTKNTFSKHTALLYCSSLFAPVIFSNILSITSKIKLWDNIEVTQINNKQYPMLYKSYRSTICIQNV